MYGEIVCYCKMVSKAEVLEAISRMRKVGLKTITIDGVKFRVYTGFGKCQGSFCRLNVARIIAQETGTPCTQLLLKKDQYGIGDVKTLWRETGNPGVEKLREVFYDTVIIGGGPAGLAASIKAFNRGLKTLLLENRDTLGGIPLQCIHPGFGLHYFKEDLTGTEFISRLLDKVRDLGVEYVLRAHVHSIEYHDYSHKIVNSITLRGVLKVYTKTIIYAAGARERHVLKLE